MRISIFRLFWRVLPYWLPLAVCTTALAGLIYLAVQQNYRISANDPQIQMAQDAARQLGNGQQAQSLVPATKVDMAASLAPYLIIYNGTSQPVASGVVLDGQTPQVPPGVFSAVQQSGREDRFSWQPQEGVRSAAVLVGVGDRSSGYTGYVLAGRSLNEVEDRISNIGLIVGLGWLVTLIISLVVAIGSVAISDRALGGHQA